MFRRISISVSALKNQVLLRLKLLTFNLFERALNFTKASLNMQTQAGLGGRGYSIGAYTAVQAN